MTIEAWILFIVGAAALSLYPGPNNLVAMTNGARIGARVAFLAGLGRLPAFAVMIAVVALGLGVVLAQSEIYFTALKWIGAAYLVYLGLRAATAPDDGDPRRVARSEPIGRLMSREFAVAATNPKAIAIFAAFFPQFLDPGAPVETQFLQLGIAFLLLETGALAAYAFGGAALARLMGTARGRRRVRVGTGAALMASGALLAFSDGPGRR